MSKHTIAKPTTNNLEHVDAPGLDRRIMLLPGEISPSTCGKGEKSAEAIVVIGNEPRIDTVEDSPDNEGLNLKIVADFNWRSPDLSGPAIEKVSREINDKLNGTN